MSKIYKEQFASMAEYLCAVVDAGINGSGQSDPRLEFAASAGLNETFPQTGGFTVPVEQAESLHERVYNTGLILQRCSPFPATKSTFRIPVVDESSRADGSRFGGVTMGFFEEGEEITASKPKFAQRELNRRKLAGIVHCSNEMLEDSVVLAATFERLFALEGAFVIEREIINGQGTRGPLGILNADATITVSAESGQGAATIQAANIVNMYARIWAGGRRSFVWLVNGDIFPQLLNLVWATGTSVVPLFQWGADGTPLLCGRPIVETEACPTLGTKGDIIAADLREYLIADPENLDVAFSGDLKFLADESSFRFRMRVDGHPSWSTPTTPLNGSVTTSPFVTLEARA